MHLLYIVLLDLYPLGSYILLIFLDKAARYNVQFLTSYKEQDMISKKYHI